MMKATAWFCPVLLTLLSATRLVCTAQRGAAIGAGGGSLAGAEAAGAGYGNGYPLDYLDAQSIQDEFSLVKRNKPSLSIVNPLDVLRQRLLLEMARRQMQQNSRQVELNRAILKNVGKRVFLEPTTWVTRRYQQQQQQQQQQLEEERQREQLRREQLLQQHFPSQLWNIGWSQSNGPASSSSASSRFFDFLQRPEAQVKQQQPAAAAPQQLLDDVNKSLNAGALGLGNGKGNGEEGVTKHQQPDGNEIANETNHENGSRKALPLGKSATGDVDNGDPEDVEQEQDDMLDELKFNWVSEQPEDLDIPIEASNANGRLPWRLIYRMHKNPHYAN
ncbi:TPR-containing protein DDB_G0280363 [Drosophila nasuta]|uniref:TPR-containing protein DDB_G0280363 n=1 Tax=Drosophila nasuta TaxID=42062 RepID=UPI00295F479F|nr:TPR-containing protein DDB_G0280363 [Drosophila nasuta]XP_060647680.1 TPR-containing protein DDB_G0280363 [Drosophila nasuta]XP_060647681.1 TPR-containing protein DDB_G0280363 [Drosophila nasuta]